MGSCIDCIGVIFDWRFYDLKEGVNDEQEEIFGRCYNGFLNGKYAACKSLEQRMEPNRKRMGVCRRRRKESYRMAEGRL